MRDDNYCGVIIGSVLSMLIFCISLTVNKSLEKKNNNGLNLLTSTPSLCSQSVHKMQLKTFSVLSFTRLLH